MKNIINRVVSKHNKLNGMVYLFIKLTNTNNKYLIIIDMRLGKAIVYSLLEFLRPKNEILPSEVSNILESFQPTAYDIDDLILKIKQQNINS